jgi:DNA-binding Xre family transcriptional regulator
MKRAADTVTLSRREYEALVARIEDLEDAAEMRAIEATADMRVYLSADLVKRMRKGEHPLRIWREFRGLTMDKLAEKSGIGQSYLSEIETHKKPGSVSVLKALAEALDVSIDDIVA